MHKYAHTHTDAHTHTHTDAHTHTYNTYHTTHTSDCCQEPFLPARGVRINCYTGS